MMIVDATNLYQIRQTGIEVLNRELGPVLDTGPPAMQGTSG